MSSTLTYTVFVHSTHVLLDRQEMFLIACAAVCSGMSRPEVPVRVDPSAWWRFAFKVVVERLRVERGWRQAFPDVTRRRRERYSLYVNADRVGRRGSNVQEGWTTRRSLWSYGTWFGGEIQVASSVVS